MLQQLAQKKHSSISPEKFIVYFYMCHGLRRNIDNGTFNGEQDCG